MKNTANVFFVRYGSYVNGFLSKKGEQEAAKAGKKIFKYLKGEGATVIVTSPLTRAVQTTSVMAKYLRVELIQTENFLNYEVYCNRKKNFERVKSSLAKAGYENIVFVSHQPILDGFGVMGSGTGDAYVLIKGVVKKLK